MTLIFGEAFLAIIKKIKAQYSFLIMSHIGSLENHHLFPSSIRNSTLFSLLIKSKYFFARDELLNYPTTSH